MPATRYPVVIFGHALGENSYLSPNARRFLLRSKPDSYGHKTPTLRKLAQDVVRFRIPSLLNGCTVSSCAPQGYNDNNGFVISLPK
jgi:hypothetical protein